MDKKLFEVERNKLKSQQYLNLISMAQKSVTTKTQPQDLQTILKSAEPLVKKHRKAAMKVAYNAASVLQMKGGATSKYWDLAEVQTLRTNVIALGNIVDQINTDQISVLKTFVDSVQSGENASQALKRSLDDANSKIQALQEKINSLEPENKIQKDTIAQLQADKKSMEVLRGELNQSKQNIDASKETIRKLTEELQKTKAESASKGNDRKAVDKKISDLEEELKNEKLEYTKLIQELNDLVSNTLSSTQDKMKRINGIINSINIQKSGQSPSAGEDKKKEALPAAGNRMIDSVLSRQNPIIQTNTKKIYNKVVSDSKYPDFLNQVLTDEKGMNILFDPDTLKQYIDTNQIQGTAISGGDYRVWKTSPNMKENSVTTIVNGIDQVLKYLKEKKSKWREKEKTSEISS